MTSNSNESLEQLKSLDDTEFQIMFIDSIYKKLKSVDKQDIKSSTLLFIYLSVIESVKKYKTLATETNHNITHKDAVNLIITKGESYLTKVANDENFENDINSSKANYVSKELSDMLEIVKELLIVLKNDLTNSPKYSHLKQ